MDLPSRGRKGLTSSGRRVQPAGSLDQEAVWQNAMHIPTSPFFERTSKRRKGFPSETQVKKGLRIVHGAKELREKLGRNDPCPCGSPRRLKACCMRGGCFRRLGSPLLFSANSRPSDGAAPGRLRLPPARARPLQTPELVGSSDHLRRPHVAPGLPPMIPRGSRALRCGRRKSSRRLPTAPYLSRRVPSKSCHASCGLRHQQRVRSLLSLQHFGEASE